MMKLDLTGPEVMVLLELCKKADPFGVFLKQLVEKIVKQAKEQEAVKP